MSFPNQLLELTFNCSYLWRNDGTEHEKRRAAKLLKIAVEATEPISYETALRMLLDYVVSGRHQEIINPYVIPEVQAALKAIYPGPQSPTDRITGLLEDK